MGRILDFKKITQYPTSYKVPPRINGINATAIAFNYYCGKEGFPLNKEKAYKYFVIGMDLGCPEAAWAVGYFNLIGEVVEQNIKKGISILERECQRNNITALAYMSKYYEYGHYVKVDKEKAYRYLLKIKLIGDINGARVQGSSDYINASIKLYKYYAKEKKEYRKALFMLNGLENDFRNKLRIWLIKKKLKKERNHSTYCSISIR